MFEFFIALFGGLFYGGKYINETQALKNCDKQRELHALTYNDIQTRYVADLQTEHEVRDFISSGKHFEDLCNWFQDDFRYVFGDTWRDKLQIPPKHPVLNFKFYKKDDLFSLPNNHITWVYHLLLAKQGKIDHKVLSNGYPIGGVNEKDITVKFAECIERQLLNSGVQGIRLVLELDNLYGVQRTSSDLCGGNIKIESLCHFPTYRLWDNPILK